MNKSGIILLLVTLHFIVSCNSADSAKVPANENNKAEKPAASNAEGNKHYSINRQELLKDFMTWYTYTYSNVKLSQEFVPLDADSNIIKKGDFLHLLTTGRFIPVKTMVQDNMPYYKLYNINSPDPDIESTMKQLATTALQHYQMEGKELPAYDFTDLNGMVYNNANTKGKILVVKCWFIHCVQCVKEFPELNALVDKYKGRDDLLFVSLAIDSKQKLDAFLKTRLFKYAVVPNEEKYMSNDLNISEYPTHILVDKNGKIVKVVNTIKELVPYLETEAEKTTL